MDPDYVTLDEFYIGRKRTTLPRVRWSSSRCELPVRTGSSRRWPKLGFSPTGAEPVRPGCRQRGSRYLPAFAVRGLRQELN